MKIKNLKYKNPRMFKYASIIYTLGHLRPMILNLAVNNETIPIKVEFSPHVFTEKFKNHIHDENLKIYDSSSYKRNKADIRAFSIHRYHMSKNLRNIFNELKDTTKFIDAGESSYIIRGLYFL